MDQPASDMPEKTEKPQNDKDYKYSPKHRFIFGWFFLQGLCIANPTERLKAKSGTEFNDRIATPVRRLKRFSMHG